MPSALTHTRTFRRAALASAFALVAIGGGCSGTTEPQAWATLTLVSGDNQTVKMDPVGPLTDFSQPVVVHLDSLGTPIAKGELRVAVWMNGMPGPNGPYAFTTGSDGVASMQLVVSNIPGPVRIEVSYVRCVRLGFFACDLEKTFATLSMSAVAVR
jgi:hypothetical protein